MTIRSARDLVTEASRTITTLTAAEAAQRAGKPDTVFVDIREREELQRTGMVAGAIHAPRGLLEFYADPSSPNHMVALAPERSLLLYCASGGRSALAAAALSQMGFPHVAHVAGGFAALKAAGIRTMAP
ncbi:rhodanese-like domain-containing protein [Aurantimonas sp. Leaf443]|uniref:rhodanese-like domain-containing protein n=1 Tax=Aurantimonas sp. Leaf443 TaxID=1736378 RepID=UPI0006FD492E|nr:rhodanese-like domain-containing protein [Aurantimonas sp. Leaf443]KQT83170.1 sulfurtransferase [Aurantimonas sp. Leaf443]